MQGDMIGVVRCARCGTTEKAWVKTTAVWQREGVQVGDECGYCDDLVIRPHREGERITFLEDYLCSGCGRSWVMATIERDRLRSLQGIALAEGLRVANYCSASVEEEFEEATGEKLWNGSSMRSDWLPILTSTLLGRERPLAPDRLRYARGVASPTPPSGPDGAMAELLERLPANPDRQCLGAMDATIRGDDGAAAASLSSVEALSPELVGFKNELDDDDSWVVGRNPRRGRAWPVWQFLPGGDLRGLVRQAQVIEGMKLAVTDVADDYPCGATLVDGAWTLVAPVRGTASRGVFLAMRRDGRLGVATVTSSQREPLDTVRERMQRHGRAVAEIGALGALDGTKAGYVAVIELEPPGMSLAAHWLPLRADQVTSIGVGLMSVLVESHMMAEAIGGLRPETIYVDTPPDGNSWRPVVTGIVPRAAPFMAGHVEQSSGSVTPYTYLYDAPEVLRGGSPSPASDVFAACAVLAHIATGEHPFEGEGAFAQLNAITGGQRRPFRGPAAIARIVDRGLIAEPRRRLTAAELEGLLAALP